MLRAETRRDLRIAACRDIRTEDAAIANAVFDASGIRVRNLPIRIENLPGEALS